MLHVLTHAKRSVRSVNVLCCNLANESLSLLSNSLIFFSTSSSSLARKPFTCQQGEGGREREREREGGRGERRERKGEGGREREGGRGRGREREGGGGRKREGEREGGREGRREREGERGKEREGRQWNSVSYM